MITLTCTNCRATLEMDDGFAGGACRCRHCGTIQTVPSHLKNKTAKQRPSRTLYQNRPDPGVPSSGLDQLANVVASSGLGSSRLKNPAIPVPDAKPQQNTRNLLIAAGVIIALLCGALIYLATRNSPHGGAEQSAAPLPETPISAAIPTPAPIAPSFFGIPLTGDTIVYVLDRGDSTRDSFDALKSATLKSITSLGEKKQFQIIFWSNGHDDAFPKNWPIYATADNVSGAERAMDQIAAHGKTDIRSALRSAMSANPGEIVIATGKAWDLDDTFVKTVDQIRSNKPVKIDAISLGDPRTSTALQTVATETHGTFKALTDAEMKAMSQ